MGSLSAPPHSHARTLQVEHLLTLLCRTITRKQTASGFTAGSAAPLPEPRFVERLQATRSATWLDVSSAVLSDLPRRRDAFKAQAAEFHRMAGEQG